MSRSAPAALVAALAASLVAAPAGSAEHLYRIEPAPSGTTVTAASDDVADSVPAPAEAAPAAATGPFRVAWDRMLPDRPRGTVAVGGGRAYVSLADATLRAYRMADGEQAWKADLGGDPVFGPTAAGAVVLVADANRTLRAFSASDGTPVWSAALDAPAVSSIGAGEGVAVLGVGNKTCAAFSLDDGKPLWIQATLGDVVAAPWIGSSRAVFGSTGHTLYAVIVSSGQLEVETILTGEAYGRPSGAGEPPALALGTHEGRVHFFSSPGRKEWSSPCRGVSRAAPVLKGRAVYAGTDQGLVYAFDRRDGKLRWWAGVGGAVSERLVPLEETLAVGAGGAVHFFEPGSGDSRNTLVMGSLVRGLDGDDEGLAVITADGRLRGLGRGGSEEPQEAAPEGPVVSLVVDPVRLNPRRGQRVTVSFSLVAPSSLKVEVADAGGATERVLLDEARAWPDTYRVSWDGLDEGGNPVKPGVHRIRVMAGERTFNVGVSVTGSR